MFEMVIKKYIWCYKIDYKD